MATPQEIYDTTFFRTEVPGEVPWAWFKQVYEALGEALKENKALLRDKNTKGSPMKDQYLVYAPFDGAEYSCRLYETLELSKKAAQDEAFRLHAAVHIYRLVGSFEAEIKRKEAP